MDRPHVVAQAVEDSVVTLTVTIGGVTLAPGYVVPLKAGQALVVNAEELGRIVLTVMPSADLPGTLPPR